MPPKKANWVDRVFPFYQLLRVFTYYLDLEVWIVSHENSERWFEIRRHQRTAWPIDLDFFYGKREERQRYDQAQIRRVMEKKETFSAEHGGLSTLYVPLFHKGKVAGTLLTGVFLKKIPDASTLIRYWKELAGNDSVESNPDFIKYVRTFLQCPLVEEPVYHALQEAMEIYAKVLMDETHPEAACQRVGELREKVFSQHTPQRLWLDVLIKNNRFYPPTWFPLHHPSTSAGRVMAWEKIEMGIQRPPDTILALRVDNLRTHMGNELELVLRDYRLQWEIFKFSKSLPNTVASPLEDYGVLFFFSPSPGLNPVQIKLEILDRIDAISKFAESRLKVKLLAGVSRCTSPTDDISRVFREAVTALGFCGPLGRPILFYEDVRTNPTIPPPENFHQLSKRLIEAHLKGLTGEIEGVRNEYIDKILTQSAGRPEIMRLHFLYTAGEIVDALRKRSLVPAENLSFAFGDFERQLHGAGTIADLVLFFREFLKRLLTLNLKPQAASQEIRLEKVRRYLDENFNLDLKMERVARENGFSTSVFARGFKKTTGAGFSAYLRKIRLENAKKLLGSSRLSVTQISQECGFNNLQYFFDVFKRATGKTPQEFRNASKVK